MPIQTETAKTSQLNRTRSRIVTRTEAREVAWKTKDAYSYDRYGVQSWAACCEMLARRGYNAAQIEGIMRSKWTRWAGDMSGHDYGRVSSKDLERFLDDPRSRVTENEVNALIA